MLTLYRIQAPYHVAAVIELAHGKSLAIILTRMAIQLTQAIQDGNPQPGSDSQFRLNRLQYAGVTRADTLPGSTK